MRKISQSSPTPRSLLSGVQEGSATRWRDAERLFVASIPLEDALSRDF